MPLPDALRIMIMSGPDDGRVIRLHPPQDARESPGGWTITFGRREECDVSIPFDTQVSRQHATLHIAPEGPLLLTDSGSLNGTFVDNIRIQDPTRVERGELFRLGRTWVRVEAGASEDEA